MFAECKPISCTIVGMAHRGNYNENEFVAVLNLGGFGAIRTLENHCHLGLLFPFRQSRIVLAVLDLPKLTVVLPVRFAAGDVAAHRLTFRLDARRDAEERVGLPANPCRAALTVRAQALGYF